MDQQEENNQVVEPLTQAGEEVKRLEAQKKHHDKIMGKLEICQREIAHFDSLSKEIEW